MTKQETNDAIEHRIFTQAGKTHDAIAQFRTLTDTKHPEFLSSMIMGDYAQRIKPEHFSEFCQRFADGVEYVRDHYGVQPAAIRLDSDKTHTKAHSSLNGSAAIVIPLEHIARYTEHTKWSRLDDDVPLLVSMPDRAFLEGVFHAHMVAQSIKNPEKIQEAEKNFPSNEQGDAAYDSQNPVVQAAREAMCRAAMDTGIVERAPAAPFIFQNEATSRWVLPYLQARTTPPSHTITEAQAQPQRVAEPSIGAGKGA